MLLVRIFLVKMKLVVALARVEAVDTNLETDAWIRSELGLMWWRVECCVCTCFIARVERSGLGIMGVVLCVCLKPLNLTLSLLS